MGLASMLGEVRCDDRRAALEALLAMMEEEASGGGVDGDTEMGVQAEG